MALEAQVVGTWGRLEGDPQLRGHFGRIPFDLLPPSAGKATLSELVLGSAALSEGGAVAALSELQTGSAGLSAGGAVGLLSEGLAGSADLPEDC